LRSSKSLYATLCFKKSRRCHVLFEAAASLDNCKRLAMTE